jgi:photosystem II stability/assembly factor-like uncharacterized protein
VSARRLALTLLLACAGLSSAQQPELELQRSGVDVRLRGLSAVDAQVAWASGRNGTVLRTVDGGAHWEQRPVPGARQLDFRDIQAFDANTALALSIGPGESSRVYRTIDGGATWTQVLRNRDERGFFDCMAFEGQRGWLLGDPVDGRFQLFATSDGGRSWIMRGDAPQALPDEAAYAASGTCIARLHGALAIATGNTARVLVRKDGGAWQAFDPRMSRGKPEAGAFSVTASGAGWFAVGGDYKAETAPGNAAAFDGGKLRIAPVPRGFRSGVACVDAVLPCIAAGPAGVERWDGEAWTPLSDVGFDAVEIAGGVAWFSGDAGRIGRLRLAD